MSQGSGREFSGAVYSTLKHTGTKPVAPDAINGTLDLKTYESTMNHMEEQCELINVEEAAKELIDWLNVVMQIAPETDGARICEVLLENEFWERMLLVSDHTTRKNVLWHASNHVLDLPTGLQTVFFGLILHQAIKHKTGFEVIEVVVKICPSSVTYTTSDDGMLAAHFAIIHDAGLHVIALVSQMQSVFRVRSIIGWSLLHYAIFYKMELEVVEYLYESFPAAVNSPCLLQTNTGHLPRPGSFLSTLYESDNYLMIPGANTPLGLALDMNRQVLAHRTKVPSCGNGDVVLFLLNKSVNVYLVPDSNGDIAFHKLLTGHYAPETHLALIHAFAHKHSIHGQGAPLIGDANGNILIDLACCLYLPLECMLVITVFTNDQIMSLMAHGFYTRNLREAHSSDSAHFRLFNECSNETSPPNESPRLVHESGLPIKIISNGHVSVSDTTFDFLREYYEKETFGAAQNFFIMTQYVMRQEVAIKQFKDISLFLDHAIQMYCSDPEVAISVVTRLISKRIVDMRVLLTTSQIESGKTRDQVRTELISPIATPSIEETKRSCTAVLRKFSKGFARGSVPPDTAPEDENAALLDTNEGDDVPGPAAGTSKNGAKKRRQRENRAREKEVARKAVAQAEADAISLYNKVKREAQLSQDAVIDSIAQDVLSNVIEAVVAEDTILRTVKAENLTKVALLLYPHVQGPVMLDSGEEDDSPVQKSVLDASVGWKVSANFLKAVAVLQPSVVPSKPSLRKQAELQEQVDTLTDLIEDLNCCVCHAERRNIFIAPCMHLCVCQNCIDIIVACPICRGAIGSHQLLFT